MLDGVIVPIQQALFSILYFIAVTLWGLNQALLLVGYYLLTITAWLSKSMFQPLLESVGNATDSLLLPVFTLAMLTLAITYLLGVFGVFRVVEFRSAILWLLVAVMWFQFGPELYLGFEQIRRELGGAFFATTFTDLTNGSGSIEGLGSVGDAGDLNINPPKNNFGSFLSFDTAIDGIDVALAYLNADGCDVLRATGCLNYLLPDGSPGEMPMHWYEAGAYFDLSQHGYNFSHMSNGERQASLDSAAAGIWRAFSGIVVSFFGMLEQVVQLLLTIAFGIGFASFFIAVLFAFFKKTEHVTWAVFEVILGLFIQSIITSLLLALVMAFVSVAGATGNGILLLGVGFIGIILVTVLLLGAVKAILRALNGLGGAFGAVTGGSLDAAGTVTQVAGAYATGGATLLAGGSVAQAAGSVLGPGVGQKAYYAAQTFGSDTALGGIAQQVAQGSVAAYLGPVGGYALGQANRQNSEDVPRTVNTLTLGTPIRSDPADDADTPNLRRRAAEGADIRQDPLSQQPYAFSLQNNHIGLRTYEDGSRLYTSPADEPLNRERARDERQARRDQPPSDTESNTFTQDAIDRIDASDDDESAALSASMTRLNALLATHNAQSGDPVDPTPASSAQDNNHLLFLAEMERDWPGSTRRPELVQQYFPEEGHAQPPQIPASTPDPAAPPSITNRAEDGVRAIRSIGPATEEHLARMHITTAGQLAAANPDTIAASLDPITPARAHQLVDAAQTYVAAQPNAAQPSPVPQNQSPAAAPSPVPSAAHYAAAVDASNNDDSARLAVHIGSAISTALNTGRVPGTNQAARIAHDSGLPAVPESSQFVQVASAMHLSPQQAQGVIQDVQHTGQIGTEMTTAIRASLASLTLAPTGQHLDDAGLSRAVGNLERAAQALVGAANHLDGAGGNAGNPGTEDRVNAGANMAPSRTTASEQA